MLFGTPEQKERWLEPLLEGEIRSAFAMTEPDVASSDARNIQTSIVRDGDDYVINGRKWWISGTADPRCQIFIVMGKTDPDGPPHRQQSMVLVPAGHPRLRDRPAPAGVRLPGPARPLRAAVHRRAGAGDATSSPSEGDGFMIAQARLGPGRIHHCMRAIGMAERALALMVERAKARVAFGRPLAEQGTVREAIALSRIEIDQARLYVLKTADLIDKFGAKGARTEISAIKVAAPKVALDVIDRAIQVHGGAGVSDDTPLAELLRPRPHAADRRRPRRGAHPRGRQGGAGPGAPLQRLTKAPQSLGCHRPGRRPSSSPSIRAPLPTRRPRSGSGSTRSSSRAVETSTGRVVATGPPVELRTALRVAEAHGSWPPVPSTPRNRQVTIWSRRHSGALRRHRG